jgi:predicted TIM-barrel fold metal-dependent hydrolase
MLMIDTNTLIGPYPYRYIPHPDPEALIRVMDREGIDEAWVGHLPSAFYRDPSVGNAQLYSALVPHAARLRPTPAIRPDWPGWQKALQQASNAGAAAIRAYPAHWQRGPHCSRMRELALACGDARLPLLLTVRFEDLRQRSPLDTAGDVTAAAIRALARAGDSVRLVVAAAGRDMIEEVHWGLTPDEQRRVYWDISWIWGPPEDHLAKLFRAVGAERFVFGSQWPLRLSQNPRANLDLLPEDVAGAQMGDVTRLYD